MKKNILVYGISLVLILIMIVGTSSLALANVEVNVEANMPVNKISIVIDSTATVEDVMELVESKRLHMDSFYSEFNLNGEIITCGYVINQKENFTLLWKDYTEKQTALLSEAMDVNAENEEMIRGLEGLLSAFENNEVKISSIICNNVTPDVINNIKTENAEFVDDVLLMPVSKETMDVGEELTISKAYNNDIYSVTDTVAANTWVPTSGTAYAWPSGEYSNATYLQLDYRWSSNARMTALTQNSKSTLEGEIVFYNYDDSAIATQWYNQTYVTNQPSPYLDTQFLDGSDEINFTVGSSYASSMTADKLYYWYAYGNRTNSNGCKAKVDFQRGHRLIAENFGDTWNVFGDQTEVVVSFSEWNTGTSSSKSF